MIRINTGGIETKMIHSITVLKWPFVKSVGKTMRPNFLPFTIGFYTKKAITISVHGSTPKPAGRCLFDLGFKSVNWIGWLRSFHATTIQLIIPNYKPEYIGRQLLAVTSLRSSANLERLP